MLFLTLSFCGGDVDDNGGGSSSGVALDELAATTAQAYCGMISKCWGDLLPIFIPEDCVTFMTSQLENGLVASLNASIEAGTASYEAGKAQSCLDGLMALGCDAPLSNSVEACQQTFVGTAAEGGDCVRGLDCTGDLYCKVDSACPGTCSQRQAEGATCKETGNCKNGMMCYEDVCTKPLNQADSCMPGEAPCKPGQVCMGADPKTSTAGKCSTDDDVFVGAEGGDCAFPGGPWCKSGLHCAATAFTPPDKLTSECEKPASSGAGCHGAAPDMCPADEYCDIPPMSLEGTCKPLPAAGESCASAVAKSCKPFHRCVDGTCRALVNNGSKCEGDDACYSASCVSGVCAAPDACTD